jgi:hypothetical protein
VWGCDNATLEASCQTACKCIDVMDRFELHVRLQVRGQRLQRFTVADGSGSHQCSIHAQACACASEQAGKPQKESGAECVCVGV